MSDDRSFYQFDQSSILSELGRDRLLHALQEMLRIRQFETRAEASYQQGHVGGFFHSYIGQEAIQTAAISAIGKKHWFCTSYRCHALVLLLGEKTNEMMAELFGKKTGNAKGRGGSMHMYSERMLGGFGIVGGQIPIATGAAFRNKYLGITDEIAVCFFGDGAVPQGTFHESLNMASIHSIPCLYVVENNAWSMGTPLHKTMANYKHFVEKAAEAYDMLYFRLDGMDFFSCYAGFKEALHHITKTSRPVMIECITNRFKGHSISDPGLYRTKDQLKECMTRDPIAKFKVQLLDAKICTEEEIQEMENKARDEMIQAVAFANESAWPDVAELGEDVYA